LGAVGGVSALAVALLAATPLVAWGPEAERRDGVRVADTSTSNPPADRAATRRLREGTELVDQVGHFEPAGQRLLFVTQRGEIRLLGLENLNLERIARTVAGSPGRVDWLVTGTVTEYRGGSFLLVERAVVKTVARTRGEAFQPSEGTIAANDGN
jgi:hypothetical protein